MSVVSQSTFIFKYLRYALVSPVTAMIVITPEDKEALKKEDEEAEATKEDTVRSIAKENMFLSIPASITIPIKQLSIHYIIDSRLNKYNMLSTHFKMSLPILYII